MLSLLDREEVEPEEEEEKDEVKPVKYSRSASDLESKYAQKCKQISFQIYESIEKTATEIERGGSDKISITTVRGWLSSLRQLNCCLSQYAHASVARVDRLQVEIALAQNSMASDLLDREACHTTTLEAIHNSYAGDSVERAMQFVAQMRSTMSPFTEEKTHGYFGAERCVRSNHS